MNSSSDDSRNATVVVAPFDYPSLFSNGTERLTDSLNPSSAFANLGGRADSLSAMSGSSDSRHPSLSAREQGRAEGAAAAQADFDVKLQQARAMLTTALADFTHQREDYYRHVETEVVQLALAIARKILHREAQMDPLLLAGVVRVALDRLDAGTKITLRVHPTLVSTWQEHFYRNQGTGTVPELVGDTNVPLDQCHLETSLGSTEIGLGLQLKEIEQGFADLLAHSPANV